MSVVKTGDSTKVVQRLFRFLNFALLFVLVVQLMLFVTQLGIPALIPLPPLVENGIYLLTLIILTVVVIVKFANHAKLSRNVELDQEQFNAVVSILRGIKHRLNNDMQVVLGNAELAEILINSGGDVVKPVQYITDAATDAVERIDELAVFCTVRQANFKPIDLNSVIREGMAKLTEEIPSIVTIELDLEHLSSRVVADRSLLILGLMHLVRKAVCTMHHGGEVVVKTSYDHGAVVAQVIIVRALNRIAITGNSIPAATRFKPAISAQIDMLQEELLTTKALVERCGAENVILSQSGDDSLFTMRFAIEVEQNVAKQKYVVS